jgi:hypothetical protein
MAPACSPGWSAREEASPAGPRGPTEGHAAGVARTRPRRRSSATHRTEQEDQATADTSEAMPFRKLSPLSQIRVKLCLRIQILSGRVRFGDGSVDFVTRSDRYPEFSTERGGPPVRSQVAGTPIAGDASSAPSVPPLPPRRGPGRGPERSRRRRRSRCARGRLGGAATWLRKVAVSSAALASIWSSTRARVAGASRSSSDSSAPLIAAAATSRSTSASSAPPAAARSW